jgi:two-component system, OmpR family, response regulator
MTSAPPNAGKEDMSLDFTQAHDPSPPPAPSPQKLENARLEAISGNQELQQAGFYVAMGKRSSVRVPPRDGTDKHTLLVVEDDKTLCKLLAEILINTGYTVRFASNRAQINLEVNRPVLPDLMLLDVQLPDADGLKILAKLRSHPKFAELPIIMMTGRSSASDVMHGLASGADGYVTKPFKMAALVGVVNAALGRA